MPRLSSSVHTLYMNGALLPGHTLREQAVFAQRVDVFQEGPTLSSGRVISNGPATERARRGLVPAPET